MLKIEKESEGDTTIIRLSGHMRSDHIDGLKEQIGAGGRVRMILDLSEVTLVDVEVVRFLSGCEEAGIELLHCPPFVRGWIVRERIEDDLHNTLQSA